MAAKQRLALRKAPIWSGITVTNVLFVAFTSVWFCQKSFSLLNILPRSRCFFKHHGVKNDYYLALLRNALLCRKMRQSVLCKEEDTKNCRDGKEKSSLSSEDFVVAAVGFEPTTNRVWTEYSSQLSYAAVQHAHYILYINTCQGFFASRYYRGKADFSKAYSQWKIKH